jgi:hypothetical protein
VLWLLGGIFTDPANMPDALVAVARSLPSNGRINVGEGVAGGSSILASALLTAWAVGAGALGALAWRDSAARDEPALGVGLLTATTYRELSRTIAQITAPQRGRLRRDHRSVTVWDLVKPYQGPDGRPFNAVDGLCFEVGRGRYSSCRAPTVPARPRRLRSSRGSRNQCRA